MTVHWTYAPDFKLPVLSALTIAMLALSFQAQALEAMGDEEMPIVYLLGEQYIKSIRDLAESDNSKMVVLPADILSTVKGMVGDKFKV